MQDVLRHLRSLYRYGVTGHLTDEQLLDRFVARRDESGEEAFAELLERHGPMVLGVCRRVLGNAHEAEDAFQATFLVLARKATSILRREHVVSWLYGVAFRTAIQARARSARRRKREQRVSRPVRVDPPGAEFTDELRAILDEEIAHLPARYQGALVLCELEGVSRPEAARRLGVPEGTLSSRLARAKGQLRDRLVRRGIGVTAGALSAALLREAHACKLPLSLSESTIGAATSVAAGSTTAAAVSASVASLAEGVLKAMLFAKLKGIVLGIGTFAALVSGAVVVAQQSGPAGPVAATPSEADRTAAVEQKLDRILDALVPSSRHSQAPEGEGRGPDEGPENRNNSGADKRADPNSIAGGDATRQDRAQSGSSQMPDWDRRSQSPQLAQADQGRSGASALKAGQQGDFDRAFGTRSDSLSGRLAALEQQVQDAGVRKTATPGATLPQEPTAADIGTVDVEQVFKGYEKVKAANKELNAAKMARKNDLMKIMSEALAEAEMATKFTPGTEDHKKHEKRATELKAQHEAGRESAEREFALREAESMATVHREVQAMVARIAKWRKLTYILKVSNQPIAGSNPNWVMNAISSTVSYADPHNDITNDVIYNLNRRYAISASTAAPKPANDAASAAPGVGADFDRAFGTPSDSLSGRLAALEQQAQDTQTTLRRLEERLKDLERLVGKSDHLEGAPVGGKDVRSIDRSSRDNGTGGFNTSGGVDGSMGGFKTSGGIDGGMR
jgi:RNA polymerase sigma factor (sigma-70 family)